MDGVAHKDTDGHSEQEYSEQSETHGNKRTQDGSKSSDDQQ